MRFFFLGAVALILLVFEFRARARAKTMEETKAYRVIQVEAVDEGKVSAVLTEDTGSIKFQKVFTTWPPKGFREVVSMGKTLLIPSRLT